jgi:hypothetical protein
VQLGVAAINGPLALEVKQHSLKLRVHGAGQQWAPQGTGPHFPEDIIIKVTATWTADVKSLKYVCNQPIRERTFSIYAFA